MKQLPIVYLYPGMPWTKGSSRQTYLVEALAEQTEVVFLSTAPYTRNPLQVQMPGIRQDGENLLVVENALGYQMNRIAKRLNWLQAKLDGRNLRRVLRSRGIEEYVFWLSVPGPEWMRGVRTDRMVYDCIDPCFFPHEQAAFDAKEYRVVAESKLVFCTAQTLLERIQKVHKRTFLLNNAIWLEDFGVQNSAPLPLPKPLQNRPRPMIGYMGSIDWRVDTETIFAAAQSLSEYTFCIAGRVNQDQEHRVTELRKLPNVVMPGSISIEEGPAYNAAFDVGLIPYLPGDIGDSINPVKMYMYLSMGKPIVTTWVRECYQNRPLVSATQTPEEFTAAIKQAVNEIGSEQRHARLAFAAHNTWRDRARQAIEKLNEFSLLRIP